MAFNHPETTFRSQYENIETLEKVSYNNDLVQQIPTAKLPVTVFLVTLCLGVSEYAVLYHCEIKNTRRTFLKGKWNALGLNKPDEEKECEELRGEVLIQGLISKSGNAYVLTQEGDLYSMSYYWNSGLGRSMRDMYFKCFRRVGITVPVLSIACGERHCLTLCSTKVFAFGQNGYGEVGVPRLQGGVYVPRGSEVLEPTEIYCGIGDKAPIQVAAGKRHSVILTEGGEVLACGFSRYGSTGHGDENYYVHRPTLVTSLESKVQQIGCTDGATYFLSDGRILWSGLSYDCRCGCNDQYRVPSHNIFASYPITIDTKSHIITSFRCSDSLVVAMTISGEALFWGECHDEVMIKVPQIVEDLDFPREIFSRGRDKDTGGLVYPVRDWTLQGLCRSTVLQLVSEYEVDELPLPTKIKRFLKFKK